MIHQRNKQKGCPKCLSDSLWNIIESYNQCLSSSKTFFSREFENVAVSWDNASAVPAWLKGTYFKNGPARFSLWMKSSNTCFFISGRILAETWDMATWRMAGQRSPSSTSMQVGWVLSSKSKLSQPAHFQAQWWRLQINVHSWTTNSTNQNCLLWYLFREPL